ncbi:MAG: c-type cytochrome [Roseococcus sp.]|jgi:sulfide dehydrogenase cytochrome subunit
MRLAASVFTLGLLAAAPALAQAPDAALLAGACQGCHGAAGEGGHGIPSIKQQQTRAEFVAAMRAFRANERPNTVMGRITRGYTDAEIAALAAHFAKPE